MSVPNDLGDVFDMSMLIRMQKMEGEFKKWMGFFGRPYTPFELLHADFLADVFADTLRSGTYARVLFYCRLFITGS